ncbi:MAG: GDSL-type esterase/lipase family protein [Caulobacterales bacterium]
MSALQAIRLDDPRLEVRGALHIERASDRMTFRRLPAWTRAQSPEPAFDLMVGMTCGVRLVFCTTSRALEIDVLETGLQFAGEARRPARIDVVRAGALQSADLVAGHTIIVEEAGAGFAAGAAQTLRFALPEGAGPVEVWLPQAAMTDVLGVRIEADAECAAPPPPRVVWAHYGSSISHGMEAAGPARTWPALAARVHGIDVVNLGLAGQCQLDGFVARALRDGAFDVISMEIGANIVALDAMRRRTFAPALDSFLDTIREARPSTPVIVLSPIHCRLLETEPGPLVRRAGPRYERQERPFAKSDGALSLSDARAIIEAVVTRRRAAGDAGLHYVDGLSLLGSADAALLTDDLHPNADGHSLLATRFAPLLEAAVRLSP